ncbi:MAG TPA: hypothetical protein VIW24_02395 [Aldersonia sp.]
MLVAAVLVSPGGAHAQPVWQTYCTPTDPGLSELSGIGVLDDAIYAIGDSGTDERIARLDRSCAVQDWLTVPVDPYDIEDLAIHAGSIWLSDTGDNSRARDTVALTRVDPADGSGELHRLTFPDGRHDVEALIVEPGGRPVLVTKEFSGPAGLYAPDVAVDALPSPGPTLLRRVGAIALGGVSSSGVAVPGAMVTGAALSLDGTVVALRTYAAAYLFPVRDGDVVTALATQAPVEVRIPDQPQGESLAFTPEGDLLAGSESAGAATLPPIVVLTDAVGLVGAGPAAAPTATTPAHAASPADRGSGATGWWLGGAVIAGLAGVVVLARGRGLRRRDPG